VGETEPESVDVAIVGGGVAGLYVGWRMLTHGGDSPELSELAAKRPGGKLNVTLFESDRRVGGRLLSVAPPGMPNLRAELGGMRFLSTHKMVRDLATELRLPIRQFPVNQPNNLAYLRDRRIFVGELPTKAPYNLRPEERRRTIGELMLMAITRVVQTLFPGRDPTKLTPAEWLRFKQEARWRGTPIYMWGFWNFLYDSLSPEAYSLVADASGYDTIVNNWNAADAIPWFLADFGDRVTYEYPPAGMQAFPDLIAERFEKSGGTILRDSRLKGFTFDGSGPVKLTFEGRGPVSATKLVLAMPRRSLELIAQCGSAPLLEEPPVRDLIASVTPTPLFKFFCCYDSPWWRKLQINQGRSVTSNPIRQVYYLGTEGEQPGGDPRNTNSLLLVYNDDRNIKYWIGLLRGARAAPRFEPEPSAYAAAHGAEDGPDGEWDRHRPSRPMTEEVQRLLVEMHGKDVEIPRPYEAAYLDWSEDPYGGGYNMWKINEKSWEVSKRIVQPVSGVPVYVCGEAYSTDQGWVEGALETAEDLLRRLGVPRPGWLSDGDR
jgi:monoamine oxidase